MAHMVTHGTRWMDHVKMHVHEREEKEGGNFFKSSQIKKIRWVRGERKERGKKGKEKKERKEQKKEKNGQKERK